LRPFRPWLFVAHASASHCRAACGLLGSSFFLLFAVSAVVTGFIVNRVETRSALLVMGLIWALTQFPMLGNAGFATLIAARSRLRRRARPA
jgi:MFS transporter, ACS family, D-galactonate transporter